MKKAEMIEELKDIYKELSMSAAEYVEYANAKYDLDGDDKLTSERAWAYRTGAIKARIEYIINWMIV